MAAVQETADLGQAPVTVVVAPRPVEGTGAPKLQDRLGEVLRARRYAQSKRIAIGSRRSTNGAWLRYGAVRRCR
jgi:hypothetical protein